jgi:hypothetical protein
VREDGGAVAAYRPRYVRFRETALAELLTTAGIPIGRTARQKSRQTQQSDRRAFLAEIAGRQRFCHQSVFAQPRPIEDSGKASQTLLVSSLPGQLWLVGFLVRVGLPRPKQNFILARDM